MIPVSTAFASSDLVADEAQVEEPAGEASSSQSDQSPVTEIVYDRAVEGDGEVSATGAAQVDDETDDLMVSDEGAAQSDELTSLESSNGSAEASPSDGSDSMWDEFRGTSWRYLNGQPRDTDSGVSALSRSAASRVSWVKSGDSYVSSNGIWVKGATGIGIDVSSHNGTIDWAKVKAAGVDFAIIRCGYGSGGADSAFIQNVRGCQQNGIPFGVYLYSYAWDAGGAQSEATFVLKQLSAAGLSPSDVELGVWYDLENEYNNKPSGVDGSNNHHPINGASTFASMAKAFRDKVQASGYSVGVYANRNWFTNYLTDSVFDSMPRWIADYTGTGSSKYTGDFVYWQCMSNGTVPGISGNVDINFSYAKGLVKESDGRYRYVDDDGAYVRSDWRTVDGSRYYFGSDGYAVKWSQSIGGNLYYFNGSYKMVTGWVQWNADGTKSYFDPKTGAALRYSQTIDGKRYYFNGSTYKAATGWVRWNADGTKSYFDPKTGAALRYSQTIDGKRYYFNGSTYKAVTGWVRWNADGTKSYFGSDGVMYVGTHTIGGRTYVFDENGKTNV